MFSNNLNEPRASARADFILRYCHSTPTCYCIMLVGSMGNTTAQLQQIYDLLMARYGPQGWWPAETTAEMIIGAILVQRASWKNASLALQQLRVRQLLDFSELNQLETKVLAEIIEAAGTSKVKARRLKNFADFLGDHYQFQLEALLAEPTDQLREQLLSINGIGPETADCILLYAAQRPRFVIDTYTTRIMVRHQLADGEWGYHQMQELFENHLPADVQMFNEYHALLVQVSKDHCRPTPRCTGCPLEQHPHWLGFDYM
ncbi:MAG: Endonuclease III [Phycisphaerae bacterium]|nr:Endonuclease III [Phycisphaerae bacterium]